MLRQLHTKRIFAGTGTTKQSIRQFSGCCALTTDAIDFTQRTGDNIGRCGRRRNRRPQIIGMSAPLRLLSRRQIFLRKRAALAVKEIINPISLLFWPPRRNAFRSLSDVRPQPLFQGTDFRRLRTKDRQHPSRNQDRCLTCPIKPLRYLISWRGLAFSLANDLLHDRSDFIARTLPRKRIAKFGMQPAGILNGGRYSVTVTSECFW